MITHIIDYRSIYLYALMNGRSTIIKKLYFYLQFKDTKRAVDYLYQLIEFDIGVTTLHVQKCMLNFQQG